MKSTLDATIKRIEGAYSPATIRAYRADFEAFIFYCSKRNEPSLPGSPQMVAGFISELADSHHKSASIRRAIAGIAAIHRLNRLVDPTKDPDVTLEIRRIHRHLGRYSKQAHPINETILNQLLAVTGEKPRGIRNRALLLIAYDTLCRRSELVSLRVEDIQWQAVSPITGISRILLRRSKTDPYARGRWLELGITATNALISWLDISEFKEGPIFRSENKRAQGSEEALTSGQVNRIFKRLAKEANLPNDLVNSISGHSIRVGAALDLMHQGASMPLIMQKGRWSKTDTVMRYLENSGQIQL